MGRRTRPHGLHVRDAVNPINRLVGQRVVTLRRENRLTLDTLASGTRLTTSFLSKLERGQTSISVDNLRNVAHFLGVEMVYFFERDDQKGAIVTRRGQGVPLLVEGTEAVGEAMIGTARTKLQATLYRTPPGQGRSAGVSHPGEEFAYVLRGRIRYGVGEDEYVLEQGDSIWHRSTDPHRWINVGRSLALSLHVNTPPAW